MKDKTSASLEALTGLLGERQRYEEWLSALESRKSSTPDSVYQKVRADYQTRLKDVSDRLGARAGELKSNIDALTAKLQEIAKQETAQHELRQEAELRAAVGEYTEEEWAQLKEESEKQLGRIAQERTSAETQLAELNRVFTLSTNPAAAGAGPAARPTPSPVVAPPAPKPPATPDQNGAKRTSTSGWPQRDTDPAPAISVSPGVSADRNTPRTQAATPLDEFTGLGQKTGGDGSAPKGAETQTASSATKSKRGGLPDLRTEQQKTLKCPECGAMNYPTEWYCERCGGELATL